MNDRNKFAPPVDENGIQVAPEIRRLENAQGAVGEVSDRRRTQVSAVFSLDDLATPPPEAVKPVGITVAQLKDKLSRMLLSYSHDSAAETFGIRQSTSVPSIADASGLRLSTAERALMVNMFAELLPDGRNDVVDQQVVDLVMGLFTALMDYFAASGDAGKTISAMIAATEPVNYNNRPTAGQPNAITKLSILGLDDSHELGAPTFREVVTVRTASIRSEVARFNASNAQKSADAAAARERSALKGLFDAQNSALTAIIDTAKAELATKEPSVGNNAINKAFDAMETQNAQRGLRIVELCALLLDRDVPESNAGTNLSLAIAESNLRDALKIRILANAGDLLVRSVGSPLLLQERFKMVLGLLANKE